ncbi:MAG: hypothetical protein LBF60_08380 [Treponema sp.]|nr:hypothetical protein [Treponema sp.]
MGLPQRREGGARSISPDSAAHFADSYEAVFRKVDPLNSDENPDNDDLTKDVYYRGAGDAGQEYISVAVPVGDDYEVLLLAGIGRTLVGAGYRGKNYSEEDKANGKGPVDIEAGKANEVAIEVVAFPPQWNTKAEHEGVQGVFLDANHPNDFMFVSNLTLSIKDRHLQQGPEDGLPENLPTSSLTILFNLGKFEPLMLADAKTASSSLLKLTLESAPVVRVFPRYIKDYFPPVDSQFVTAENSPYIASPDQHTYTIEEMPELGEGVAKYKMLMYINSSIPKRDVDALIQFDLKYRAFGFEGSGGRVWTIRNGLYNTPDDQPELDGEGNATGRGAGAGSYIPVIFGAGTPAEKKGQETIIYVD